MDFQYSAKTISYLERVRSFIAEQIAPVEQQALAQEQTADWTRWRVSPAIEELKAKARQAGLWNLFLPDAAAGLTTLEYAPLAEEMGKSLIAAEIFNCNAPDTGNMEILHLFGTPEQKKQWLEPLLAGEIRSVFAMTEPDVASSDATNMRATIVESGGELVLNGRKWWSTGLGHPDARIAVFMGVSDAAGDRHSQHSMVLVPLGAPGVTIKRMLPVFGEYDAPYGHGEVWFEDVRVPKSNVLWDLGKGYEIAQRRLGPGRIHHCMRAIGAAEKVLELLIRRGSSRVAFGKPLLRLGGNLERVAKARVAIDQARLLTLYAAWKIDTVGAMAALTEISAIKAVAPTMLQTVVDDAIQIYGGAGLTRDVPLAAYFGMARSLRIADGPDEVHWGRVARLELAKYKQREP
jgi:acyl-CoA dehydrogenase